MLQILRRLALPLASLFAGFVLAGALTSASSAPDREPSDYTRTVARPQAEVAAALQEAAKRQGFKVSGTHDLQASLKKEGIDRPPYTVVELCRADLASKVLKKEPRFGALMPCGIAVYEADGKTTVSTVLPSRLMAHFPSSGVHAEAGQVDRFLKTMIDEVTRN